MKKFGSILAFAVCVSLFVPAFAIDVSSEKANNEDFTGQSLIYEYAEAISSGDVDRYINLFTDENRRNMHEYLDEFGETDFFFEENVEILNISELSTDTAELSAGLSPSEISDYENIVVLYAETRVNGEQTAYKAFILVNEYNEWKILGISTPDLQMIVQANEGFGTKSEREQLNDQEDLKDTLLERTLISAAAPDADPTEITVMQRR